MLTGRLDALRAFSHFRFFFIIGIPRTGGTYPTKQFFRATGVDYKQVQNTLAHDGFPHLATLSFQQRGNVHTNRLVQLAEYLTMVEMFFTQHGRLAYHGGIVVPKKFTKAIYNFPLLKELFGSDSEYIMTLRHPLSIIQSTLDKSGGLPEDGKFKVRSVIERGAMEDSVRWGISEQKIAVTDYYEVFLSYWKRYHYQLALEGIQAMPTATLVPYSAESMTPTVKKFYDSFGVEMEPEEFKIAEAPKTTAKTDKMAEVAVSEVAIFWSSLGLTFPVEELSAKS